MDALCAAAAQVAADDAQPQQPAAARNWVPFFSEGLSIEGPDGKQDISRRSYEVSGNLPPGWRLKMEKTFDVEWRDGEMVISDNSPTRIVGMVPSDDLMLQLKSKIDELERAKRAK